MELRNAQFGDWEIVAAERILLVAGTRAPIGSRAFDILAALVVREGDVVSKRELLETAWRGLVVEENNLSVQISTLRKWIGAGAITTVPGIGYRLSAPRRVVTHPPERRAASRSPISSGLFGRESDLLALNQALSGARLVSIVGPGGVGKTVLGHALVEQLGREDAANARWIDLAPLQNGRRLHAIIAKAFDIESADTGDDDHDLLSALAGVHGLVVIDSCEHLLADVAVFVQRALDAAPGLQWLATSQAPLHLADERVHRLLPLEVPAAAASLADALCCSALRLLVERVTRADASFVLHDAMLPNAIALCRQLDGIPLAIEMAASRVATLGLRSVSDQLGKRMGGLAGVRPASQRHATLRGTLDWSYGLLSSTEQTVFRRLQPFLGGFTLALSQGVVQEATTEASLEWATMDALAALIDKSLVQRETDRVDRFFLFESARAYALDRLRDAGEEASVARRHAEAVTSFFDDARDQQEVLRDEDWEARYVPERHNVLSALAWACTADDPDLLAALVAALAQIDLFMRGPLAILSIDIPIQRLSTASPYRRAWACLELGWAHYSEGNRRIGTQLTLAAYDDLTTLGDAVGIYRSLVQLVRLYEGSADTLHEARDAAGLLAAMDSTHVPLRTRLFCEITIGMRYLGLRTPTRLLEWKAIARSAGFDSLDALCSVYLADDYLIHRRFDEAFETCQRYLDGGGTHFRGTMLLNQVLALVRLGRLDQAIVPARAALRALPSRAYVIVVPLALAATLHGCVVEAALISGYSERVRGERDKLLDPAEADAQLETVERVRVALGEDRCRDLMATGAALSTKDVFAMIETLWESMPISATPS